MLMFCTYMAQSQTERTGRSVHATNFGNYNYVSTFDGSLNDLDEIVSQTNMTADQAKDQLKSQYEHMSGISIDDTTMDAMLDPNQANYNIWMDVYNSVALQEDATELFVLRSIIMCIKGNM